jgi:hypothetical protein
MAPKGIAFDPVAGFFELAVYLSDRRYLLFDLWEFGITGGDYELCWLSGMRRVLCSSSEVYRVNRCVEIVLLLLWPNLSTAVRTFESASSPL